MTDLSGIAVFGSDTEFQGRIRDGRVVEIRGAVEGELSSQHVIIQPGGRFLGRLVAGSAEIHGELRGEVFVKSLIKIGETGLVEGKVQYGAITMAPGGDLVADLYNVPPTLSGDFEVSVHRGRSAVITRDDLRAVDPDDAPEDLTFEISRTAHGHVALRNAPAVGIAKFTQADLNAGKIVFQHDGSTGDAASFDVSVRDDDGASAGTAQTVKVQVAELVDRRAGL
ncbi:MAG: cadherin-like domain-containing protein [Pseudomonadota bacterium]